MTDYFVVLYDGHSLKSDCCLDNRMEKKAIISYLSFFYVESSLEDASVLITLRVFILSAHCQQLKSNYEILSHSILYFIYAVILVTKTVKIELRYSC